MKTIKTRLLTMKAQCEGLSHATKDNRKPVAIDQQSVGRLSRMDSLQVQAMDHAQEQARQKSLLRINAALVRIENDEYGLCVMCGDAIEAKRLDFDPSLPLCIECAKS